MIWESKRPGETVSRRWEPSLDYYENILTATVTTDEGTVTATAENEVFRGTPGVTVLVSGGASGETARLSIDVVTTEGRTLIGVFHIGVLSEAPVLSNTASEVCAFALRKVAGVGNTSTADELNDALERLNMMIALWRIQGLDIGVTEELAATDTLAIPDAFVTALKLCLRKELHDFYGVPLSALDVQSAIAAEAAVLAKTLQFTNLTFDRGLLRHPSGWDFTRGF